MFSTYKATLPKVRIDDLRRYKLKKGNYDYIRPENYIAIDEKYPESNNKICKKT